MIDMMDLSLKNKTVLLSNLSFDHPLVDSELNDLIMMLSSPIFIGQIYFKDDVDVESIEKIKLLLEGLPNIDDSKIEKYIMKNINSDEKETLESMNFLNIDTWNIAYSIEENKYSITSLPKYRMVNEWFSNVVKGMDEDLPVLSKLCYLYDKVKMFEYDRETRYSRLPEIISSGKANSYGYNLIYSHLLSLSGIPSRIFGYENNDGINYITMAIIDDKEWEVSGIYIFDPSLDTISKDQYKNYLARRMNYNFFAITMDKLSTLKDGIKPIGLLRVLMSKDDLEYQYNLNQYIRRNGSNNIRECENSFEINLSELHSKIINTSEIDSGAITEILTRRVSEVSKDSKDKTFLENTIMDNYSSRNSELFDSENIKRMFKSE